jgi:hypothetical protein
MVTHMMVSEDVKEFAQLTVKSKRMVTIKRVSNILLTDAKTIKAGHLLKQGDSINKKTEEYGVVVQL